MTFTTPAWFWAMLLVAAAAAWAMFRPARKRTDVASLSLWQEAVAAVPPAARRARRLSWSWLLLLAGASAAVLALTGPVVRREAPGRHVAIAVRASAELSWEGGGSELRRAAGALLDRLSADDSVQLVLPLVGGGAGEWRTPAAARQRIDSLDLYWAPADQLPLPTASADAQHTWIFTPAGAADAAGPKVSVILLPAHLPPVTVDAIAAVPEAQGRARLFVAFRNQTDSPRNVTPMATVDNEVKGELARIPLPPLLLPPGGRGGVSASVPAMRTIHVAAGLESAPAAEAWLVRRERPRAKVAMIGPDEPLVRRFIGVCPGLELTGTSAQADLIIANAPAPGALPADKPALVLDPQGAAGPMSGWTRADASVTVVAPAVTAGQDPVMQDVSLAGLAVRRVRPWVRQEGVAAAGVELAQGRQGALILRSDPAAVGASGEPRRVHLAFDIGAENAHFDRPEMLPILLANATAWLLGGRPPAVSYEAITPMQAGAGGAYEEGAPAPGLYHDKGTESAVNLTGLRALPVPVPPLDAVARALLPEPQPSRRDVPLWPALVLAAMGLWLGGWAARSA